MPRRRQSAPKPGEDRPHPATQLIGSDAKGNVRPADNRFLSEDEIAMRDAYVAQETGPEAQQLLIKAEAPEHVAALSDPQK